MPQPQQIRTLRHIWKIKKHLPDQPLCNGESIEGLPTPMNKGFTVQEHCRCTNDGASQRGMGPSGSIGGLRGANAQNLGMYHLFYTVIKHIITSVYAETTVPPQQIYCGFMAKIRVRE